MFFSTQDIQKLLSKCSLLFLVAKNNISISKKNNVFVADTCPFCRSKHTLHLETDRYCCYGCGKAGNAINFIMDSQNLNFSEAVLYLSKIYKMPLKNSENKPIIINYKKATTLEINNIAAKYYYQYLRANHNSGLEYLDSRQIPENIKTSFGLGFSGPFGDNLYQLLKSKGYSDSDILESGLISKSKKPDAKKPFYDKFWDRVIFPIFDSNGKVVAFGGRVLDGSKPKYLNSPETAAYVKGDNLYCYDKAKKSKHDYFICCEGYMDAITMHQFGFDNAVASLGTALTKNQIKLLTTKKELILAYDTDSAGINATRRAIKLCREANLPVRVLQVSNAKDPDEFLKKFGAKGFQKLIDTAESDKHFMIRTSMIDGKFDFSSAAEELL